MPNSNSVDNFASLDTPGNPRGVKVVELYAIEKKISCFVTVVPPLLIFSLLVLVEMLANVSFILSMAIKKSIFVSFNSHNFNLSTGMHFLKA